MDLERHPVRWAVTYPAQPHDPIGAIALETDGFRAWLREEDLGVFVDGDAAVEAVWHRYVDEAHVQHDAASRTHGSDERSGRSGPPRLGQDPR